MSRAARRAPRTSPRISRAGSVMKLGSACVIVCKSACIAADRRQAVFSTGRSTQHGPERLHKGPPRALAAGGAEKARAAPDRINHSRDTMLPGTIEAAAAAVGDFPESLVVQADDAHPKPDARLTYGLSLIHI